MLAASRSVRSVPPHHLSLSLLCLVRASRSPTPRAASPSKARRPEDQGFGSAGRIIQKLRYPAKFKDNSANKNRCVAYVKSMKIKIVIIVACKADKLSFS
ncbi:hypothetical protein U9M48_032204 [Paspalum notatum var. saurae]|uniref:Uncharacterized protein n=1 Tax=Paspalum notatum var. saurae TaxID=547442 RepID=A0AAQ3X4J4_PASNO